MREDKNLKYAFLMDAETYLEIVGLAQKHGKKPGESMKEEFEEVMKKRKDKIQFLGTTDKDIDLLTGELRERGLKIYNSKEEERKRKKNNE